MVNPPRAALALHSSGGHRVCAEQHGLRADRSDHRTYRVW